MHSTSDNIKFTPYNDANEVVNELFEPRRSKYQDNLETSTRGGELIFDSVNLCITNITKKNLNVVVDILIFRTG